MKNIYLFKIILISSILMVHFQTRAEILATRDVSVIKDKIAQLKTGDMVLFDVKGVIFYSGDQVMFHEHKKSLFNQKFAQIEKNLGKEEAIRLKSIILNSYEPAIVDHEISEIIKKAQKSGVVAFALTSGNTGNYGIIKNRADLRVRIIKDIGIDFSKSMDLPYIDLGDDSKFSTENYQGNPPLFQEGIIFCSKKPKGEILSRFLKVTKLKPPKIIFIDNQLRNVISVEKKCQELGIEYVGIYFTKIYKESYEQLDKKLLRKNSKFFYLKISGSVMVKLVF